MIARQFLSEFKSKFLFAPLLLLLRVLIRFLNHGERRISNDKAIIKLFNMLFLSRTVHNRVSINIECIAGQSDELDRAINFAAYMRDAWVAKKAEQMKEGTRLLDAGAGECKYRELFRHVKYFAHDFAEYSGTSSGPQVETWHYGKLDYVSDITQIPVDNESFDVILCTEVLEHVPEPIAAMKEFSRILKSKGTLLITTPLGSGLHQEPFHFYGGFTPHFYEKYLAEFGFTLVRICPLGGLMRNVGQESARIGRILSERHEESMPHALRLLFSCWLPAYLKTLDDTITVEQFTVGYVIEAVKG